MPDQGKDTAKLLTIRQQTLTAFLSIGVGQVQIMRIEECPVLDIEREFEKRGDAQGPKDLGRPIAIPDSLVISGGGIVSVTAFFQDKGGWRMLTQPVDA